jgi:hypothetical protein
MRVFPRGEDEEGGFTLRSRAREDLMELMPRPFSRHGKLNPGKWKCERREYLPSSGGLP